LVGGRLVEVSARTGAATDKAWRVGQALPPRPLYFGGLSLPAPPRALAAARYDLGTCVTASYNHRHEEWLPDRGRALRLDCCGLAAAGFPFVVGGGRALVAGATGEGQHRALDLREHAAAAVGRGPRGAPDEDAEAAPLVLAAAAAEEKARRPGGPDAAPCLLCSTTTAAPVRAAALVAATLTSLACVIALAWWLPGRGAGGGAGRPRSPVRGGRLRGETCL